MGREFVMGRVDPTPFKVDLTTLGEYCDESDDLVMTRPPDDKKIQWNEYI